MSRQKKKSIYLNFDSEIRKIGMKLKTASIPGFESVPVYDVFIFFISGLKKGSLNLRATAIAFNFMLALGPALIFFLALLPYFPISNFQKMLENFIFGIIPSNSYIAIQPIIDEIFQRRSGLPLIGLVFSLFFAQKGINGIIEAFNASYHTLETRSWYRQRIVSIILVFIFMGMAATASMLFISSKVLINNIAGTTFLNQSPAILNFSKWMLIIILTFFSISILYYLGPSRHVKWSFFSVGSTLATLLTMTASLGFSYFMDHFAQLNRFFGSIGAFMALMLWINFNALSLLIGFELNASINNAHLKTESDASNSITI